MSIFFKLKTLLLLFLILLIASPLVAQPILVYPPTPPAGLTEAEHLASLLAGSGVEISNVTRICADEAFGVFRAHPNNVPIANFGINEGVLLSTGHRDSIPGPSSPPAFLPENVMGTPGDEDLEEYAGVTTQDACVIEFDIVPLGETLSFRYVFGSEEYDDYVCTQFNDIFAFLVTGPNPAGGDYEKENIALIPGTDIPVAVSTVNDGFSDGGGGTVCILDYSEYYNDVIPEIEFEGLTDTLTAFLNVVPCETYTLKLAIADGVDSQLNSGVFLEAGSFTSPIPDFDFAGGYETPDVENGVINLDAEGNPLPAYTDNEGNPNGVLVEGCIGKTITFSIENIEGTDTINLEITGTAENGADFSLLDGSPLPTDIALTSENDSISFELIAIDDGINEFGEYIVITIIGLNDIACVLDPDASRDTIWLVDNTTDIAAAFLPPPNTNNYGPFCYGTSVPLSSYGGETYEWFPAEFLNDPTSPNPIANITENVEFGVIIENGPCRDTLYLDEITIFDLEAPSVQTVYNICTDDPIEFVSGVGSYSWSPAINLTCTNCPNPVYIPDGIDTTYFVNMFDEGNCFFGTDSVKIIYENPTFLDGPDIVFKCTGEEPVVDILGGFFDFKWEPATGLSCTNCPSPAIETDVTTTYTLTAKNVDGCEDQFDLLVEVTEVFIDAGADILECTRVDSLQIGNSNPQPGRTYSWSPTTGLDDPTAARPYLTLETDSLTPLEIVYTLTITDESLGCTISDEMTVSLVGHPSVSILGEEPTIIRGTGANLVANGIDNAGSYLWSPPTGLSNTNGEVVTARPDTTQLYIVEGRDEYGCKTEAEIVVNVIDPPRINVPTAFTPNGDGIHDFFRPVSKDIELQTFQVFNRWGEMVYDDISDTGWDGSYNGEIQGLGVYVYFIQYRFIAGDKIEQLQGSVTLIR